jgi:hypothetical protein
MDTNNDIIIDNCKHMLVHKCPICNDVLEYYSDRYPKIICFKCANCEITDDYGNLVSFSNVDDSHGGFVSFHKINNTIVQKSEHVCWINNIKCYASEQRYGGIGIVIQKI